MPTERPTVAVIVGAGASLSAGAPSTADLLDIVIQAIPKEKAFSPLGGSCVTQTMSLSDDLQRLLTDKAGRKPDFETILLALEELLSYFLGSGSIIQSLAEAKNELKPAFEQGFLFHAHKEAINAIIRKFLASTLRNSAQMDAQRNLKDFFQRMAIKARVAMATLNYDTLLDDVIPWFDGFLLHERTTEYAEFNPMAWQIEEMKRERNLMMHLHGSLRFGFRPTTAISGRIPFDEPVLYSSPEDAFETTESRTTGHPHADGRILPATPIIAGGNKSPKLMHNMRPYAYYNASALRQISTADRLLIIGYGFRDEHVNVWIEEYRRLHPDGRLLVVTMRSGYDLGENTPLERFLMTVGYEPKKNFMYSPVEGGEKPQYTHGRFGNIYLVTTGVPMTEEVQEAALEYLFPKAEAKG